MTQYPYDVTSPESIRDFAKQLMGKSLEEAVGKSNLDHEANKGNLGTLVERYYYRYAPDNHSHGPDFAEAGVELKTTGVAPRLRKKRKDSPAFKAKERLVLMMINYAGLANETWTASNLLRKCRLMLVLFNLYQKDVPATQRKFVMSPILWEFPQADLEIIRQDWEIIRQKVRDGKAHELSEGDTFYLGASRKGAGGLKEKLMIQPFSDTGAKSRAFSLKPSYVNTIIDKAWVEGELIKTGIEAQKGLEELTLDRFRGLEGLSDSEIAERYGYSSPDKKPKPKNYYAGLSLRILGSNKRRLPEFEKAGVTLRTMRLRKNGTPKEAISFSSFDFAEIANQEWEESSFYEDINKKFFFVIFQYDKEGVLRFKKCMFWNMPYADRLEAEEVWRGMVEAVRSGDMNKLPKISDDNVAHVRPKGAKKTDTLLLPNGGSHTKQCFWLNAKYVKVQLEEVESL